MDNKQIRRPLLNLSKLITFIFLMALTLATMPVPQAQERSPITEQKRECGTIIPPGQLSVEIAREAAFARKVLVPQANAPYQLPLTIHIVRRSNGTGGFTLDNLAVAIHDLNRMWQTVGIQFFIYGAIDYINNDGFFNVPDDQAKRNALRQVNPVANTINVHFTNLASLCGESTFTTSAVQGILMDNACAGIPAFPSTFAHEVGHYFDLYHTHETGSGVECPSGSNCATAGDLLCDTPADPNLLNNVNSNCVYIGSAGTPTGCGSTAYDPPVRNLMSYSDRVCRNQFTNGQISKTLNALVNSRSNLINSFTKYVAPNADPENTACTYQSPCRAVATAVTAANNRDHIFINPGLYPLTPLTISKQVFLENWNPGNGVVQLGR